MEEKFDYAKAVEELEKIAAKVNDGILTVSLPKLEASRVKVARSIEIG